MEIIVFNVFISMVLLAILLEIYYYLYNNSIYKNNASKIYFDINKDSNINFEEKYTSLAKKHNSYVRKYRYTWIVLASMIGVFVSGLIIGSIYLCLFFIAIIIIVLLIPKGEKDQVIKDKKNANQNEETILKTKYFELILNKMIIKIFNGEKQKLIDSSMLDYENIDDVDEFEYKCNLIEEQERKENEFFSKLFEKTNKKYFKDFYIEFCINFKVDNKKIKLSRIGNYKKVKKRRRDISFRRKYINSFVGYLVEIPDFLNKEKLNNLDRNDYVLEEETNTLYVLISDQIKSSCYSFPQDRFIPELYLKFEKNRFLEKNYIYFEELYKFICSLIEN